MKDFHEFLRSSIFLGCCQLQPIVFSFTAANFFENKTLQMFGVLVELVGSLRWPLFVVKARNSICVFKEVENEIFWLVILLDFEMESHS